MHFNLPQGITLRHLIVMFNLRVIPVLDTPEQDISEFSIHSLRLGEKDHILPFPGCEAHLFPVNNELILQIIALPSQASGSIIQQHPLQIHLTQPESTWNDFCSNVENWLEQLQGRILVACEEGFQLLSQNLSNQHSYSIVDKLKTILGYDIFLLDNQLDVLAWVGGEYLPEKPVSFLPPKIPAFTPATSPARFIN